MLSLAMMLAIVVAAASGGCYHQPSHPAPKPPAPVKPTTPPDADQVSASIVRMDGPLRTPPPIIADVDRAAILRAWQGNWVIVNAIAVQGDRSTDWQPAFESTGRIEVLAPCEIALGNLFVAFTLRPGVRVGDSGFIRGDTTIVCIPHPYVLDSDGCHAWTHARDGWHSRAADCRVRHFGGTSTFVVDDPAHNVHRELAIQGETIFDPQDDNVRPRSGPYPSFDAARRAVTSDPYYVSLTQSTFLDSPGALIEWQTGGRKIDGERVDLDAVFVGVGTAQDQGHSTAGLLLANQRSPWPGIRDHTILCIPAAGMAPPVLGASVEATGTVHVTASAIELRGCAVRPK